ncbi:hypothetical protein RHBI111906_07080 [Rhodothermus bifroesti]|nr:hypothetical protein HRbin18_01989 [bacterium HR18]
MKRLIDPLMGTYIGFRQLCARYFLGQMYP